MFLLRRVPLRAIPRFPVQQQRRALGSVSAIDSAIFRTLFGTEEIRKVFDDRAYVNRCVDAETALARAQSKCNVIPSHIGELVTTKANELELDFERLRRETEIVGYPIFPLIQQLSASCGEEAGRYVHWGATTQDIMDLASMLQMKEGLQIVERTLRSIIKNLENLSKKHRDTPMAGRTHLQHALPITFGHKLSLIHI